MASYVSPKIRDKFESLSIDLKNDILERNVQLYTLQDLIRVLEQIVQPALTVTFGRCGGADAVLRQKLRGGCYKPFYLVGRGVRAELRGGDLPQKLRKGQFRSRHGSFERIQLLPLFAAAVRIALHGAAGQILPKHGKQMQ